MNTAPSMLWWGKTTVSWKKRKPEVRKKTCGGKQKGRLQPFEGGVCEWEERQGPVSKRGDEPESVREKPIMM